MIPMVIGGSASVVLGGQFGSEAKGLAASYIALEYLKYLERTKDNGNLPVDIISTSNAGAQAGHTTILPDGRKFVCYHLPTFGVLVPESTIYINAGAIINPVLLDQEIHDIAFVLGIKRQSIVDRLIIHPNAAIIHPHHSMVETEATLKIASTMKGVGAALADKIMRKKGSTAGSAKDTFLAGYCVMPLDLPKCMTEDRTAVVVEIPQGTGLSLNNSPFFPHCTSRDCWLGQGLTDAGIHPRFLGNSMMVQRTYPIRVGNVMGPSSPGMRDYQIQGFSGDFYKDSMELSWERDFQGIEPERTTVTKRVRRIATWSYLQYEAALRLNRPDVVLTTFTNYMTVSGLAHLHTRMELVHQRADVYPRLLWSFGPKSDDVVNSMQEIPIGSFRPMAEQFRV